MPGKPLFILAFTLILILLTSLTICQAQYIHSSPVFGDSSNSSNYEKVTNSTGTATLQGKVNLKNLPTINHTQLKQQERRFLDFVPGNLTLFRQLKTNAPFNNNVTTNVVILPPLRRNFSNFTESMPLTTNLSSGLSDPIVNVRNVTVKSSESESGVRTSGFVGLISNKSCGSCTPPDVQIAVGRDHIVEMINNFTGIWNKQSHNLEKLVRINDIFNLARNENTSDPYVLYDSMSKRWFSSVMVINKNVSKTAVLADVSLTSDPLGDWNIFRFNVTNDRNASYCPDRPIIATSNDKLVISVNIVPPDGAGSCYSSGLSASGFQVMILNKNQMINDTNNNPLRLFSIHDMWRITMVPAKTNEGTKLFMVSTGWQNSTDVKIISIDGSYPHLQYLCSLFEFKNNTNIPPDAKQPGTDISIDTADSRVLDATYRAGKIWLALDDSCRPIDSDRPRSCLRLIQVNVSNHSAFHDCNTREDRSGIVTMNFDIGHHDTYYYRPSLTMDAQGNLFVVFGYSSGENVYPSLAVLKLAGIDRGSVQVNAALLKEGIRNTTAEGYLFEQDQTCPLKDDSDTLPVHKCTRYGDYFSAVPDPDDPSSVWVAGQYYENSTYSTYISRVSSNGN